jgi:hypothetical protein
VPRPRPRSASSLRSALPQTASTHARSRLDAADGSHVPPRHERCSHGLARVIDRASEEAPVFEDMLGSFLSSTQGQQAAQALSARGIGQEQVRQILSAAFPAAASSLGKQASARSPNAPELGMFDLLGGHPGQAFLIGAATSMMRGESITEAAQDGAMSVVGAHVAEVIASRVGLDRQTAGMAAAVITPFLVGYVHDRLASHPDVVAQRGEPSGTWQEQYAAKHGAQAASTPQGKPMQGDALPQGKPMQAGDYAYGTGVPQGKPMPSGYGSEPTPLGKPMPTKPMQGKPVGGNPSFRK